jgi:hypothetical protein
VHAVGPSTAATSLMPSQVVYTLGLVLRQQQGAMSSTGYHCWHQQQPSLKQMQGSWCLPWTLLMPGSATDLPRLLTRLTARGCSAGLWIQSMLSRPCRSMMAPVPKELHLRRHGSKTKQPL